MWVKGQDRSNVSVKHRCPNWQQNLKWPTNELDLGSLSCRAIGNICTLMCSISVPSLMSTGLSILKLCIATAFGDWHRYWHTNRQPIWPRKKNVEFPLTWPTLFYGPDPTDFIGKFVYTELKGQYKTVKPLSGDCKNAGHWTCVEQFWWDLMKKDENQQFNQCPHEITYKIKKKNKIYYRPTDPNFFGNVSGNSTLIFFGLCKAIYPTFYQRVGG